MADILLKSDEMVHGHIDGFFSADDPPRPAVVDGPPRWSLSNAVAATLVVSDDGMDVDVIAIDMVEDAPPQVAVLEMRADANRDPNVQTDIVMVWNVIVTSLPGPVAATAGITFGAPVKK